MYENNMEKRDGDKPSLKDKFDFRCLKGSLISVEYFLNNFTKCTKFVEFYKCFKK